MFEVKGMNSIKEKIKIDPEEIHEKILTFIKGYVYKSKTDGVVVGISGGIDSSLTAKLSVDALGNDSVIGLLMPENSSKPNDIQDAKELAELLGIHYETINITPIIDSFDDMCEHFDSQNKLVMGNLKPRIRMQILYYHANILNRLVIGTSNKTELLIGYFTKYGDGGVDFEPIGDLYKTQVWQLSKYLKIPQKIIEKKPSAGLWIGQTTEGELGIKYTILDSILYGSLDLKMNEKAIAKELNISMNEVQRILNMVKKAEHKRKAPPVFILS